MKSPFLSHLHHAYAQTDGTYAFPNTREGDMLKQAKKEVEELRRVAESLVNTFNVKTIDPLAAFMVIERARKILGE